MELKTDDPAAFVLEGLYVASLAFGNSGGAGRKVEGVSVPVKGDEATGKS